MIEIYPIECTYVRIEDILWSRQILRAVKVWAIWWGKEPCSFILWISRQKVYIYCVMVLDQGNIGSSSILTTYFFSFEHRKSYNEGEMRVACGFEYKITEIPIHVKSPSFSLNDGDRDSLFLIPSPSWTFISLLKERISLFLILIFYVSFSP